MARVMVAMSGGVDSSVAAVLLAEQGHTLCGATLRLYDPPQTDGDAQGMCGSLRDAQDARMVAGRLGFPHYTFSFQEDFKKQVIGRFAEGYRRGETPNPCIDCNRTIKFPKMLEKARELGWDYIATGHYVRCDRDPGTGRYRLRRAADLSKDQTYVLYGLTQEELAHTLFPLGDRTKEEIRCIARDRGLVTAHKPDSQDICFVKDGDYAGFLQREMGVPSPTGDFVTQNGDVLGRHKGIIHYTIGQRKGLGLSLPAPLYVTGKDTLHNRVILGPHEDLMADTLIAGRLNWVAIDPPEEPLRVMAKARYRQPEAPATLTPLGNGTVQVVFDQPQRALTPGQAVVFYRGDVVLGGGTILKSHS